MSCPELRPSKMTGGVVAPVINDGRCACPLACRNAFRLSLMTGGPLARLPVGTRLFDLLRYFFCKFFDEKKYIRSCSLAPSSSPLPLLRCCCCGLAAAILLPLLLPLLLPIVDAAAGVISRHQLIN